MSPVPVFGEVAFIANATNQPIGEVAGTISSKDLEEVRSLVLNPPPVVQRTLEVTYLILNASRPSCKALGTPDWSLVQRMLSDVDFSAKILEYDVQKLRADPALCTFIMNDYFRPNSSDSQGSAGRRRSVSPAGLRRNSSLIGLRGRRNSNIPTEPLSFARVHRASQAAGALFRWCVEVMESVNITPVETALLSLETPIRTPPKTPEPVPRVEVPLKRSATSEYDMSARAPRAKAKASANVASTSDIFTWDRYFQSLIAFPQGGCSALSPQIAQLRLVAEAMKRRPGLTLQLAEYSFCPGMDSCGPQRLYSVKLFLDAENIPYVCMPAEQSDPRQESEGVLCTLRMDNDQELLDFFTNGPGGSDEAPTCPNGHTFKRCMANGESECTVCRMPLGAPSCFYKCDCQHLCSRCYAKRASDFGRADPELREIGRWLSKNFRMC
jgi:hypothetical protein